MDGPSELAAPLPLFRGTRAEAPEMANVTTADPRPGLEANRRSPACSGRYERKDRGRPRLVPEFSRRRTSAGADMQPVS